MSSLDYDESHPRSAYFSSLTIKRFKGNNLIQTSTFGQMSFFLQLLEKTASGNMLCPGNHYPTFVTHLCHSLKQGQLFTHGPAPKPTTHPKGTKHQSFPEKSTGINGGSNWEMCWRKPQNEKIELKITYMERVIITSIEGEIPLKTLSSGWGLGHPHFHWQL